MRPDTTLTLRARLPLLWLVLLLLLAILLPHRIWTTLLIGFGGLLAIAYLWARELAGGLAANRRLRFGWVAVGDRLEEQFEIRNHGRLPALWVEIVDETNVPGYRAAVVRSAGVNQVERWRESALCTRRGQFRLGPWQIRTSDPFGLFQVTQRYEQAQEIIIHPPIHGQLPLQLPAGQSDGRLRAHERAWSATINAASVRDYQPQDPLRWIHWPTSARRNELFVREFDLDVSGDLWLLLDLETAVQLGQGPDGTEEHAVLLAASLGARALRQNRAVGLAAYGQVPRLLPPGRGGGQQWQILRALALLQADGQTSLGRALGDLARVARRGTTAVIITPSADASWLPSLLSLARAGVQPSLILLDRASFSAGDAGPATGDAAPAPASHGLRDAARRLGFACAVVRQGELGQPLDAEARRGHWEFRVTGTGRVVTIHSPLERASSDR